LVSIAYFVISYRLATPYQFFPSDDKRSWDQMRATNVVAAARSFDPVMATALWSFHKIATSVPHAADESPSLLVTFVLTCYMGLVCALSFLVWQISRSWRVSLLAVVLFLLSGWPATYCYLFSYTPLSTFFAWLAVALLIRGAAAQRLMWIPGLLAGVAAVACVGTSVSGGITLPALGILALIGPRYFRKRFDWILPICFSVAVAVCGFALWRLSGEQFQAHISENINSGHYVGALKRFLILLDPPLPSGLWVLWNYNKTLTIGFLVASAMVLATVARGWLLRQAPASDPLRGALAALVVMIWLQALIIDLLPTTKLGRAHFVWFPGVCALLALTFYWILLRLDQGRRWMVVGVALVMVATSAFEGLRQAHQTHASRQTMPRLLAGQYRDVPDVFLLLDDPHVGLLTGWLESKKTLFGTHLPSLTTLVTSNRPRDYLLVVGPSGPGSGRSILAQGCLPDFLFDVGEFARKTGAKIQPVPYYAYTPAFLMEEEICQSLLFEKLMPDPDRDPEKRIRLLWWPAKPQGGGTVPGATGAASAPR
jgi:hypothetical protein